MKQFLIFVLLLAFNLQGDAKKVCILFEQENVLPITILKNEQSVAVKEEILDVQEDIVITLGDISEVTDEISTVTVEAVKDAVSEVTDEVSAVAADATTVTAKPHDVSEAMSLASNVTESKLTNICALEGITLFDHQNVSNY